MVSDEVQERLTEAGRILDEAVKIGNKPESLQYSIAADNLLDNIKIYVSNQHEEAWQKILGKEKELNGMFNEEFKKETLKIQRKEEYYKFLAQHKIEAKLMTWKAKQKLGFYEWLAQKYDI